MTVLHQLHLLLQIRLIALTPSCGGGTNTVTAQKCELLYISFTGDDGSDKLDTSTHAQWRDVVMSFTRLLSLNNRDCTDAQRIVFWAYRPDLPQGQKAADPCPLYAQHVSSFAFTG